MSFWQERGSSCPLLAPVAEDLVSAPTIFASLRGARFLGVQGDDPLHLAELCVPAADVAGRRQLRSASRGLLNFPRYNMPNYGRRAFCFAGPHVWNSLPEHIRQSTSIAVFKRSLKTFLVFYSSRSYLAR